MNMMQIILLVIVIGVIIALMIFMMRSPTKDRRKIALEVIGGRVGAAGSGSGKDGRGRRRADLAKKLKESEQDEAAKSKNADKSTVKDMIQQAGLDWPTQYYWFLSLAICLGAIAFCLIMHYNPIVMGLFGVIGFLGVPRFIMGFLAKRRQKKFLEELPDCLESMVRLLKAGMPMGESIAMVAREYTGPVGEEMVRVYQAQKIGIPMAEAVQMAARRIPITEMQMFATGIAIQQQTGSSLSEVLLNLAGLIRARFRLKRKVQALSAEAKASAGIIGSLPIIVGLGLYLINPDYVELLWTTPTGKILLTCSLGWMSVGVLMMKQMINFKV